MRRYSAPRQSEEEGESVFVSMTDMTISILFIALVLLAFFASRYNESNTVPRADYEQAMRENTRLQAENKQLAAELAELRKPNPLEVYMAKSSQARLALLEQLRDRLKSSYPDLPVNLIAEEGALRFQGEGLFATDSYSLTDAKLKIVESLAKNLQDSIGCYSFPAPGSAGDKGWRPDCNPSFALIEAIQIEGHTDSTGEDLHNLNLSANRAVSTFTAMTKTAPDLLARYNMRNQPLLSVAGYGRMRPVAPNNTAAGRAMNRRIDLRIIMHLPADIEEIDAIKNRFAAGLKQNNAGAEKQ